MRAVSFGDVSAKNIEQVRKLRHSERGLRDMYIGFGPTKRWLREHHNSVLLKHFFLDWLENARVHAPRRTRDGALRAPKRARVEFEKDF